MWYVKTTENLPIKPGTCAPGGFCKVQCSFRPRLTIRKQQGIFAEGSALVNGRVPWRLVRKNIFYSEILASGNGVELIYDGGDKEDQTGRIIITCDPNAKTDMQNVAVDEVGGAPNFFIDRKSMA
jgi:hypothetical protein